MAEPRKHRSLSEGRWETLSLMEQLGNIGSEVSRANRAKNGGNETRMWAALERALELIDLTAADRRWIGRTKEVLRARELICDYLVGDNEYGSTSGSIDEYFLPFAVAARAAHR